MLWSPRLLLVSLGLLACIPVGVAEGQTTQQLRRNSRQAVLDAQIGNQQVQRQSEVMRLERMIGQFESRVIRLERQLMSLSRLPTITMAEAKAGVEFAELQLRESEKLHKQGEMTEIEVAADRLALARAKGQFDAAEAAHAESLIRLEMDVLFAERQLLERTNESSQLERLVAKGYASSNGLAYRKLDVGLAEKQLLHARLRLETHKKSAGEIEPPGEVE
jgi:hypothetical protein